MSSYRNDPKTINIWQQILDIRSEKRFSSMDIVQGTLSHIFELHGDRYYGDDPAIIAGLAYLKDLPITFIAEYKGNSLEERVKRNYGMPLPEGYRKALRVMRQAEKFGRAIICFIDTPGAYPGVNAEERGQAEAIARNLCEMFSLNVPIISIVISEGGSGGALALGIGNKTYMLEKAIYSVVSPEGCASILWKDSNKADIAAAYLKISAQDIFSMGIIDGIISEENGMQGVCVELKNRLYKDLKDLYNLTSEQIKGTRKEKFEIIGAL